MKGENLMALDNENEIQRRKERKSLADNQKISDIRTILSTPEGERFFFSFFEEAKVLSTTFHSANQRQQDFEEGARSLGLKILHQIIQADPVRWANVLTKQRHNA